MSYHIQVSSAIKSCCPEFVGACLEAHVINSEHNHVLWEEIASVCLQSRKTLTPTSVKDIPSIAATRSVYKRCGKDPSRYRPAAEALLRRAIQDKPLYSRDTLVDLINLASMVYGYSIGGFDADKIDGTHLTLGIGESGEPYEGIGRGNINIEGLPVYRDQLGGIGTPTSDHERTKITASTTHLLVLINGYDGDENHVIANVTYIQQLLKRYAESDGGKYFIYK